MESSTGNGGPREYEVVLAASAEADIDAAHAWLSKQVSFDYAERWQDGLVADLDRLTYHPTKFAIAPESDILGIELRSMLYCGPSGRRQRPTEFSSELTNPKVIAIPVTFTSCMSGMALKNPSRNRRLAHGLEGGLYGVHLGGAFFGESIFNRVDEAGKAALVHLAAHLQSRGFRMLEVQMVTPLTAQFKPRMVGKREYARLLASAISAECEW